MFFGKLQKVGLCLFLTENVRSFSFRKRALLTVLVVILSLFSTRVSSKEVSDSLTYHIYFTADSDLIDLGFKENDKSFTKFYSDFTSLCNDSKVSDIRITVRGNSSIEGPVLRSFKLAEKRAEATSHHILSTYPILKSNVTILQPTHMIEQTESVIRTFTDPVPGVDLAAVLDIAKNVGGSEVRDALLKLDSNGYTWQWFSERILTPTRYCEITTLFTRTEDSEPVAAVPVAVVPVAVVPETIAPVAAPDSLPKASSLPRTWEVRLGTNLLYDIVTVANLTFEVGFAKHFAFNVLTTYSPWDIQPDLKLRTLLIQPEFRGYFAEDFRGHFIGVEGHYGWYNIALKGSTRYQDKDGNTPLWGVGLTYGYVLPFNEHWGMEFAVSAGYAKLYYDCFYNIENGAKYTTDTKDWWGPTKALISIYYQF